LTIKSFYGIIKVSKVKIEYEVSTMSKNSNKLQLSTRLKNAYYVAKASGHYSNSTKSNSSNQFGDSSMVSIEQECNKPLQSASWVSTRNKPRQEWYYNKDRHYGVYRAVGNLWLCRDRQAHQELSECEREQLRLYRQLKREYEREQKLLRGEVSSDTTVTKQEKLQAVAKKQAIKLLNGLTCSPRYDRIYAVG
jgi:hypothetical protein